LSSVGREDPAFDLDESAARGGIDLVWFVLGDG
jgi:hypothetical protein